ncbi:MAG TPA: methylmalonyl-CoA mutase subunit beta, partial [Bacteroidales bacterium]|nr:methylmalonyl-CoA mutase subunit beta [Bacteroidales bacterium]
MTSNETSNRLFDDFPPVSPEQWEAKIREDLQGADYEKKLVWKADDGISVQPYYTYESIAKLPWLAALPGQFPYVRGNKTNDNSWEIRQHIETDDITVANRQACDALARGATALSLNVGKVAVADDLINLLRGIDPTKIDIHFYSAPSYNTLHHLLVKFAKSVGLNPALLQGSFDFDPLSWLLLKGDFYRSEKEDFDQAATMLRHVCITTPKLRVISINGSYFNDAGATKVQELGYSLAVACEYFDRLSDAGFSADEIAPRMQMILAAGSNYFIEIAAFRAARALWARMTEEFKTTIQNSNQLYLGAVTSNWNMTIYDPYVNMLRTTLQAMSAAVAGADSITVLPFDRAYRDPDDFALRIARNQQLILKEEAYLHKVVDPAGGSYYIENLTKSLAENAWNLFRNTEKDGGVLEAIKRGTLQDDIHSAANKKIKDVATRRSSLVGTNLSPNNDEKVLDNLQQTESEFDDDNEQQPPARFKKLKIIRAADAFEDMRLAVEIHTTQGYAHPVVFLLTFGNPAMRRARAGFAHGFFGCAGYKVIDNAGFASWELGVEAAIAEKPAIVVICSSDDEY